MSDLLSRLESLAGITSVEVVETPSPLLPIPPPPVFPVPVPEFLNHLESESRFNQPIGNKRPPIVETSNEPDESTALAIPDPPDSFALTLINPDDLFKGTPSETIASLVTEHDSLSTRINRVSTIATGEEFANVMDHFICGNCEPDSRSHSRVIASTLFKSEGALKSLSASMWKRAMQMTDVYDSMPQDRRSAWDESIQQMTCPEFTLENVHATLGDLLSKRIQFLSERVDGIFRNLSSEHLTNCPQGFNRRMIIGYIHSEGYPDSRRTGFISDLRHVIAKFMGRDLPHYTSSHELIRACMRNWGQWIDVDGGSLRIRVYKKGTAHMEVHPEMAWRLNAILSHMHPRAIASEHKRRPVTRDRTWKVMQQPLPYEVLHFIADLKSYCDCRTERVMPYYHAEDSIKPDKRVVEAAIQVMESLGAVFDGHTFTFEFDPTDVLDLLECSGCIPDHVSHQYFPTPRILGEWVVSLAGIEEGHTVLEPSAGQGHIADLLPYPDQTLCIELSKLHCAILRSKKFDVVEGDFLAIAHGKHQLKKFDRIVMNPPFRDGQHHAHLVAACDLLSEGGRLVCILPGGEKEQTLQRARKAIGEGFEATWHRVPPEIGERFPGTSIKVGVIVVERRSE